MRFLVRGDSSGRVLLAGRNLKDPRTPASRSAKSNRSLAEHPRLASARWRRDLEQYRSALAQLYDAVGAVSGLDLIIDSSKRPSHVAVVGQAIGGSTVAMVHLVRDSRAVAFSLGRHKRKTDSSEPEAMMQRMSAVAAARSWNRSNLLAEYVARRVPASVRVRYEDLVTDPGSTMDLMAEMLGTKVVSARPVSGAELHLSVAHTVSGNPMRLTRGPVELRGDDEWVRAMDPVDKRAVTRRTWPLLRRYGY